ncbi:MAG: N-acetylmuramoyl-L-alanine amidase [Nitrosomonas sp.]|nr:N-acetylmuramoyl-L-alanine amidase [Nitrosomonas sp.]
MFTTLANPESSLGKPGHNPSGHRTLPFLYLIILLAALLTNGAVASNMIKAARYYAGPEHTRITLESTRPVHFSINLMSSPKQITLDLENINLLSSVETLPQKINAHDRLVKALHIERISKTGVRLVIALKTDVVPRTFTLNPVDRFAHRLVLDMFPPDLTAKNTTHDPILALLRERKSDVTSAPSPIAAPILVAAISRKPDRRRLFIIAIDAGHGGKDPGAVGDHGTHEKQITLSIAKKLKTKLDKEPNIRAVLIRDGDYFLSLAERRARARKANADLFVSIHADAAPRKQAHGSSVYALSENGATSTTASWLAKKENNADLIGGITLDNRNHYLKQTLLDLSMKATIDESIRLASKVLSEIGAVNHLHKKHVEQAGFAVLKSPDIPSILIETAFISNKTEEKKLRSEQYQHQLTDAILSGLKRHLTNHPWQTRTELAGAQ